MKSAISLALILSLAGSAYPAAAAAQTRSLNESPRSHIVRGAAGGARAATDSKQVVETISVSGRVRTATWVRSSKRSVFWVAAAVAAAGVVALWLLRVERCSEQVC
jgi:hypothetical protein